MHARRVVLRVLVVASVIAAATVYLPTKEPVRGIDLHARLVSSEPLAAESMESCRWDVAAPERTALQARQGAAAGPAMGDPTIAARMPVQTIRDPYAGFAAIRVDPVHNEVVIMDEFKFNIYVYDRLAVTPASAMQTTPKRFIGGGKTLSRYNSDGYVDTKTGDIYIVNNDSEPGMFVFPRTAEGNVAPARELLTPYGAFGLTVDEQREEMFVTIQHDGAIQVYQIEGERRESRTGWCIFPRRQRDSSDSGSPDAVWPTRTALPSIRRPGCSTSPTMAPEETKSPTPSSRCRTR